MAARKILLMMTGSIAAYKACHVISRLTQAGHQVQVVASPSALQFVGAPTLEGLSGRPVLSDLWTPGRAMDHIHLIREADLILVAPATAHFLNRIAQGLGDDLLTTLFLAHDFKKPFLVAPAMNTSMYLHPATQKSLQSLKGMGLEILETASGVLACGETGFGKLLEPDLLLAEVLKRLPGVGPDTAAKAPVTKSRTPIKFLITAGGTQEPLDDVRVITNKSTGRSGANLADHLSQLGFEVTLLRAQSAVPAAGADVQQKTYVTHADLKAALQRELSEGVYTHVVHMAAVSDYQLERVVLDGADASLAKLPSGRELQLILKPTEKLLPQLQGWSKTPLQVIAFKLTSKATQAEREQAVSKILPSANFVVSNDLSEISESSHPYLVYSKGAPLALNGASELAGFLAELALKKEIL